MCLTHTWKTYNEESHILTKLLTYLEDFSHLALLREGAVVLYGQDDRHVRIDKRRPVNRFYNILEDRGRDLILRPSAPSQIKVNTIRCNRY